MMIQSDELHHFSGGPIRLRLLVFPVSLMVDVFQKQLE